MIVLCQVFCPFFTIHTLVLSLTFHGFQIKFPFCIQCVFCEKMRRRRGDQTQPRMFPKDAFNQIMSMKTRHDFLFFIHLPNKNHFCSRIRFVGFCFFFSHRFAISLGVNSRAVLGVSFVILFSGRQ